MAQRMRVLSVSIEYVDHQHGLWCNTCMLSTGIRVWVAVLGPTGMHLQARLWCYEHQGSRDVVVET